MKLPRLHTIWRGWLHASFANQIILFAVSLTLGVSVLIGAGTYVALQTQIKATVQRELAAQANLVESRLSHFIMQASAELATLSRNSFIVNGLVDSSGRDGYLRPFLRDFRLSLPGKEDDSLTLYDFGGKPLIQVGPAPAIAADTDVVGQAIATGKPQVRIITQGQQTYLKLVQPIHFVPTQSVEGALVVRIQLAPLLASTGIALAEGQVLQLQAAGTVVALIGVSQQDTRHVERTLKLDAPFDTLRLRLTLYSVSNNSPGPLEQLTLVYAAGILFLLPMVGWLAHHGARHLVVPLGQLSATADAIARSGVITVPLQIGGPNEVGRLADTFARMLARLGTTQAELNYFKNTLDQTLEALYIFDPESLRFTYVNEGAKRQTGYSQTELMQMTPINIRKDATLDVFTKILQPLRAGVLQSLTYESVQRHKDGHEMPVEIFLQFIRLGGQAPRFVAMATDISARKAAQAQIEYLAFHDALTGLPNRLLAKNYLEQAVLAAERENTKVALLFIDLDKFKTINDSLGHVVGDGLLKAVAVRLRACLRDTDTLSRQGGDEFLIVLNSVSDAESVTVVVEKILVRMAEPFEVERQELSTSLSIGIAVYPEDGKDFDTLLKQSDTAMYRAKDSGRNTYRFHTDQMNIDAIEHLRMRNGLRRAMANGEFVLHYQPQIGLASGTVIGTEALIRWNHPELGMVAPGRFISVAEDTGLIVPMGDWVLREACRQSMAWRKAGQPKLLMAVNLSAMQFKRGDILKSVTQALVESGLEPALLELELTESILIEDTEKVLATVRQLKSLGVKLSIDDFGTGYSSLSYLKQFDVDKLKIDQSFVRNMVNVPNDAAIVRAIIQMAKSLNLTTIAEGVEDEHQLALLRFQHCDEVQGYHFARPMPADAFQRFMVERLGNP